MKYLIWCLIAGLVVLHQSGLFADDERLVFGFLPAVLAFHIGISIAAGVTWYLAARFAWPEQPQAEPPEGSR